MDAREITEHENKRELEFEIAEHQVLLSFTNDVGAIAFNHWWDDVGEKLFVKWVEKNKRDYT